MIVTGRSVDGIDAARSELPADVAILQADSASLADTDRLVAEVRDRFGTITGLFLNAGITRATPIDAVDEADYDAMFATNTKGQYFTLQKALPLMAAGTSAVFTVGVGADHGIAGGSAGAGSNGALLGMTPRSRSNSARAASASARLFPARSRLRSGRSPDYPRRCCRRSRNR